MPAKTHTTALRHIHNSLRELKALPTPENPGVVADLLGEIRHIETLLADWRKGLQAETEDGAGTAYEIKTTRVCNRSFNLTRAIVDTADAIDGSFHDGLDELVRRDAIRVSGQWKKLKAAFVALDIPLVIAAHEIVDGDLDEAHVGEDWVDKTTTVAVKP